MKITFDISRLVEEGKLTRQEADKLTALAAHDTGSLGINILIGFGVVAIAAGAVALVYGAPRMRETAGCGEAIVGTAQARLRHHQGLFCCARTAFARLAKTISNPSFTKSKLP
jgi:hypothetical protein